MDQSLKDFNLERIDYTSDRGPNASMSAAQLGGRNLDTLSSETPSISMSAAHLGGRNLDTLSSGALNTSMSDQAYLGGRNLDPMSRRGSDTSMSGAAYLGGRKLDPMSSRDPRLPMDVVHMNKETQARPDSMSGRDLSISMSDAHVAEDVAKPARAPGRKVIQVKTGDKSKLTAYFQGADFEDEDVENGSPKTPMDQSTREAFTVDIPGYAISTGLGFQPAAMDESAAHGVVDTA